MSRYFIATPIFYVNAAPHIGHLYTALIADVLHRWMRIKHSNPTFSTIFSTGTDEHGTKIQRAAENLSKTAKDLCDENSAKFRELFIAAGIEPTCFIRTTDAKHVQGVQRAWKVLRGKNLIVKGQYSGWYCTSDETFVPETQLRPNPTSGSSGFVSAESGHPVEWMQEENYIFKLSHFQEDLKRWLQRGPIIPSLFNEQVLHWLDEREQPDLSVSRSAERLSWGIPVPDDPQQMIYVWLDALMNYLTVCGWPDEDATRKWWPADLQIVGKDILKFHAIYWPAFLMGLGLEPPKRILCHSHWLIDHRKMSKSLGNVVDPFDRLKRYSVDGFRYFLMREGVPHSDANYSDEKVVTYLNTELANTMGNLLNRCTSISVNPTQTFPSKPTVEDLSRSLGSEGVEVQARLSQLPVLVDEHYEACNIYKAIDAIMAMLRDTNALMQMAAPWTLAKSSTMTDKEKLDHVIFLALETLRVCGVLLAPVTPNLCNQLLTKLNFGLRDNVTCVNRQKTGLSPDKVVLFNRIITAAV